MKTDWDQGGEGEQRDWHLDKKIGLAHIFSTIAAIGSLIILGSQFNTRLSIVEQMMTVQKSVEARQEADAAEFKREMHDAVKNINDKLDRLIERGK